MSDPASNPSLNWRALLAQLAVVILGVLIAIGAAHGIGAVVAGQEASRAKARIEPELRQTMVFLAERSLVARCLGRRLDMIEAKLLTPGDHWTPIAPAATTGPQAGSIVPIPLRRWSSAAWQLALADGSAAHLSDDARTLYGRIFRLTDRAADMSDLESDAAARLNVLTRQVTLSNDTTVALIETIEAERARNRAYALDAAEAFALWRAAGRDEADLLKAVRQQSPLVKACTPPAKGRGK
jgi:hypothetical protein